MSIEAPTIAYEPAWRERFFSGSWKRSDTAADVIEPATGSVLTRVGVGSASNVADAAGSAADAQQSWAETDYGTRSNIIRRAADLFALHRESVLEWIMREAGSVRAKAAFEVDITIKAFMEAAAMPSQPQGLVLPSESGRISFAKRAPLGVVGVISPFNFPLYLSARAVAPALAIGNAVVLKPDLRTPVSGGFLLAQILTEAGLPPDVFHVLPGHAETGSALCSDPNIAMIHFTGSTRTGRLVSELSGRHLKKVSLELGGKNALIVLDDADLDLAVSNAAWGAYFHQGQVCMGTGRILVQESIRDEFVRRLSEKASSLRCGNPMTTQSPLGPVIDQSQLSRALAIIDDAVTKGARLAAGGGTEGLCLSPTVLSDVDPSMRAFQDEIFAPVAAVASFQSDDDAVQLANATDYGLSAAVISQSVGRAMALGRKLKVGMLHINDQTIADDVVNPIGGQGASGNGTTIGGPANWDEFSQWQWVTIRGQAPAYPI